MEGEVLCLGQVSLGADLASDNRFASRKICVVFNGTDICEKGTDNQAPSTNGSLVT
jgi:hypothetical protein